MNRAIEYDIGAADLDAFFVHHARNAPYLKPRNRRMRWVWTIAFAAIALVAARTSPWEGAVFAAFAMLTFAFYVPFNVWWYARYNRRIHAGAGSPDLGRTRLEHAHDDRLTIRSSAEVSTLPLSSIRRIEESPTHHFLYLGPAAAIIVPKSGAHAGDIAAFMTALRDRHAAGSAAT